MPDKMIAVVVRFLEQGKGKLSKRAREKEFKMLGEDEIVQIEMIYSNIFI